MCLRMPLILTAFIILSLQARADKSTDFTGKKCVEAIKRMSMFANAEIYVSIFPSPSERDESYKILRMTDSGLVATIVDFNIDGGKCLPSIADGESFHDMAYKKIP